MVFSRSGRSIFPLLPPYGAHDANGLQGRAAPLHPDGITPYLGLQARLSQICINRWTILLLLVLFRALMAASGLNDDMATAKREALSACTSVESMGSSMASMPHYLAQGVNELTAAGVEEAVKGLTTMLTLTVTAVEAIVLFIIKLMYSTYLCLITLAVRGSVQVAVDLLGEATEAVNNTIKSIGNDIYNSIDDFQKAVNSFADIVNTVGAHVPAINISSKLDALEDIHLPSNIDKSLDTLNSSLPTFGQVENFTQGMLSLPFEEVKKLINESWGTYTFDRSVLLVPEKKQLSFCNDNNGMNDFFDDVTSIIMTARKIFIIVLIIAAVLACVPVAWQEIRRWRHMKERSQLVRKEAHDPMDVVYIVSRPYTAGAGIKAASRFSNSRRQILVRWAIAYATTLPALFVLCLGIAGLISCLCQYLLIRSVQHTVPELTTQVTAFADKVVDSLQASSVEWANNANSVIQNTSTNMNDRLFGWVNTSSTALNNTLNTFVDRTTDVLNDTFGGTILYDPVKEVFNCLVLLKIQGIEKGLTWVSDHAYLDFPLLPNDTFSRGAASSINSSNPDASDSFLADSGDQTSDKISEAVVRVIDKVESGIQTEAVISAIIVLIWVFIALIGILRALALFWTRERTRGEGGGFPLTAYYDNNNSNSKPDPNGFIDVPLTSIPTPRGTDSSDIARSQPAPRYEAATQDHPVSVPVAVAISTFDEKTGWAGQRNYKSALKVDGDVKNLRSSAHVEYGSEKH